MCVCVFIYIYIEREREREREGTGPGADADEILEGTYRREAQVSEQSEFTHSAYLVIAGHL